MHPMEPVELNGDLVGIEPLSLDHAAGLLAAADADEVFAWLPYPRPTDLDRARAWIDNAITDRQANRRLPFAILNIDKGSVIGSTSYWDFDANNAHVEIGSTWLSSASWRTGRNERSQRSLEALGAIKEGVHRHEMQRRDGSWRDSVHYSILRPEWPDAKHHLLERLGARG